VNCLGGEIDGMLKAQSLVVLASVRSLFSLSPIGQTRQEPDIAGAETKSSHPKLTAYSRNPSLS